MKLTLKEKADYYNYSTIICLASTHLLISNSVCGKAGVPDDGKNTQYNTFESLNIYPLPSHNVLMLFMVNSEIR